MKFIFFNKAKFFRGIKGSLYDVECIWFICLKNYPLSLITEGRTALMGNHVSSRYENAKKTGSLQLSDLKLSKVILLFYCVI